MEPDDASIARIKRKFAMEPDDASIARIKRKFAMKQNNTPSFNIISIQLFDFYSDEDLTLNNAIGVYTPRVLTA
jgi:hypothetical protein